VSSTPTSTSRPGWVRAAPPPRGAAAERGAEERVDDVADAAEPGAAEPERVAGAAGARRAVVAEAVVAGALLRVGEHLVGVRDLLEGLLVTTRVGVVLAPCGGRPS
jgi:hypothetical protein